MKVQKKLLAKRHYYSVTKILKNYYNIYKINFHQNSTAAENCLDLFSELNSCMIISVPPVLKNLTYKPLRMKSRYCKSALLGCCFFTVQAVSNK